MPSRFSLFNDPVHGFVAVPKGLLLRLVGSPEVQRLRRIRQLGLGFLVFPGAVHTRFEHGLGAMALMQAALDSIREQGTVVATDELEAALAAALLHDVGHGPFSHTLEAELLPPGASARPFHHERMSRALIARLDAREGGALGLALDIFDGTYPRSFFHSLLASQLDMDRLDYLRRDSFYTGVAEGVVGVERILKTMRVHPAGAGGRLVIEAKGAYAVENLLLSRRLMYLQVYLHKTVVAADVVLRSAIARARQVGPVDGTSPALEFFLGGRATADDIADAGSSVHEAALDAFTALDDSDVLYSLKRWATAPDRVLADLARRMVDRDLFGFVPLDAPATPAQVGQWTDDAAAWLVAEGLADRASARDAAGLYVSAGVLRTSAYRAGAEPVCVLDRDGHVREFAESAGSPVAAALRTPVEQPYVCLPKPLAARLR